MFLRALMFRKELDQAALGEIVGDLDFDQSHDAEASARELDKDRSLVRAYTALDGERCGQAIGTANGPCAGGNGRMKIETGVVR
jgi:hypothetical protein